MSTRRVRNFREKRKTDCSNFTTEPTTKRKRVNVSDEVANIDENLTSSSRSSNMTASNLCRLCVKNCNEPKDLYDENGCCTEICETIKEYLHPKFVDMELAKHLSSICLQCWQHLIDFQNFQMSVMAAQTFLDLSDEQHLRSDQSPKQPFHINHIRVENEAVLDMPNASNTEIDNIKTETLDASYQDTAVQFEITDVSNDHLKLEPMSDNEETILPHADSSDDENLAHFTQSSFEITDLQDANNQTATTESRDVILDFRRRYEKQNIDDVIAKCMPNIHCDECSKVFEVFSVFKQHFEREHATIDFYISCFCSEKIKRLDKIKDHFLVHNEPDFFKCGLCDNRYKSLQALYKHLTLHHAKHLKDVCTSCGKSFLSKKGLTDHYNRVHRGKAAPQTPTNIMLDEAHVKFVADYAARYKEHRLDDLVGKWFTTITCVHCLETFQLYSVFKSHYKLDHPNVEFFFKCFCSPANLKTSENIKTHFLLHIDPNFFKCGICGHLAKNSISLNKHLSLKHSEYMNNVCTICGKSTPSKNGLILHQRKFHSDMQKPISGATNQTANDKQNALLMSQATEETITNEQEFAIDLMEVKSELSNDEFSMDFDGISDDELPMQSSTATSSAQARANENYVADIRWKYRQQDLDELVAHSMPSIKCEQCLENFDTYSLLNVHFQQEHAAAEFYMTCACSTEKLKRREQIKDHFFMHKDVNFFKCGICGKNKWNSMNRLLAHLTLKHAEYLKYICSICNKCFTTQGSLSYHYKKAHNVDEQENSSLPKETNNTPAEVNAKFVADMPPEVQPKLEVMDIDMANSNEYAAEDDADEADDGLFSNLPPLENNETPDSLPAPNDASNFLLDFNRKYEKYKIDNLVAEYMPMLQCVLCSLSFEKYSLLKLHFGRTHAGKKFYFTCSCSDEKFAKAVRVKDHFLMHNDADFFKCGICGLNTWKTKASLGKHMRSRHLETLENVCTICGKCLPSKVGLSIHYTVNHKGLKT